jgi:hypothetical protein
MYVYIDNHQNIMLYTLNKYNKEQMEDNLWIWKSLGKI